MMESSHNFLFSCSKGAEKFDHENWSQKLREGSAEKSLCDDPALGLELDGDPPKHIGGEVTH